MCREYQPEELVAALRRDGARLVGHYLTPEPDTDRLIDRSVAGNTFRGFPHQRPSEVYRGWARNRMTFSAIADLGEVADQQQMDALVDRRFLDLSRYWAANAGHELAYGGGRKMVNLLHKAIVRDTGVSAAGRRHR